jgi:hypothetical protein
MGEIIGHVTLPDKLTSESRKGIKSRDKNKESPEPAFAGTGDS